MIHPSNDKYNLKTITVSTPYIFKVGDTRPGRASCRDWLVNFHDETTLMIAPADQPDAWQPAHIYSGTAWIRWRRTVFKLTEQA